MTTAQPPSTGHGCPSGSLDLDSEFWRFSLSFYSRPGVAPACLVLQGRCSVDVNVLLLAIFAAAHRDRILTATDLRAADDIVSGWRTEIVEQLRHIRTRLKSGPMPAPSTATEDLRTHVKAAELKAEQIEQALLMAFLDRLPPASAPTALDADAVVRRVIRHFSATPTDASPAAEISQAIHVLTDAIIHAAHGD